MKKLLLAVVLLALAGCGGPPLPQLKDGDIVFQTSRSSQSEAIQMATHSRYSHMGIVFFRDGKPYVFEAEKTVRYTPLGKWISRGVGGHYVAKRLIHSDTLLTPEAVARLEKAAEKFQGKPYDITFEWSDDRIYCSELVWKIYDRGLGIRVGRLHKLRDFDLSNGVVKTIMKKRYGDHVPLDETVISPVDMFSSDILATVASR